MQNIYVAEFPVQGELGETKVREFDNCPSCDTRQPEEYYDWKISFDIWNGEDAVELMGYLFISERLKSRFQQVKVKGVEYVPIEIISGDYFEITEEAYQNTLPQFYYMDVKKEILAEELPGQIYKGICDQCQRRIWEMENLDLWLDYSYLPMDGETEVQTRYLDPLTWNQEDFFKVEKYSEVFFTEKVKQILESLNQRDTNIFQAKWTESISI